MNFFSIQRAHNKGNRKSAHKKPKIRWHLLGLADPMQRDSPSSIEVIREGVASLAKDYPLTLQPIAAKQESKAPRSKKKALRH